MNTTESELTPQVQANTGIANMNADFADRYFVLKMPWDCGAQCKYLCEGHCEYTLEEADPNYTPTKLIGRVYQTHQMAWLTRMPFQARLCFGDQEVALSNRIFKYPIFNSDAVPLCVRLMTAKSPQSKVNSWVTSK